MTPAIDEDAIIKSLGGTISGTPASLSPSPSPATANEDAIVGKLGGTVAAPPAPPALSRAASAFWEGTGKPFWDMLQGAQRNADPEVHRKAVEAFKGLVIGALNEPGRVTDEFFNRTGNAVLRGDFSGALRHLMGATPLFGAGMLQAADEFDKQKYAEAFGHAGAVVANAAAPELVPKAVEAVPVVAKRTSQAIRAAAPDVAKGSAKVATAYVASQLPIPEAVKYGVGIPSAASGVKQIGRGLRKGVETARQGVPDTAAPAAPVAAPEPVAPAAPEAPTPVTGITDDALVQLYSVESDPVKRAAIRDELTSRGLTSQAPPAPATTPLESNPYREYTQAALRGAYDIETNPAKRTLIEEAAQKRGLSLLNREGRRATAAVPETGYAEDRGPSLTQDDVLMLRFMGETDPASATAENIATARQLAGENPELVNRLRTGQPIPPPAPPIPPEIPPPAPAPETTPAAPAAPAEAPATPPPAEAPTAPVATKATTAEIAQQLEEMTRPDRVTGFLKANFQDLTPADIDKFDPHDWELIGKGAGGQTPTPEHIQEIRGNIAASAAPLPPEVATMPPAQAEAAAAAARGSRKPPAAAPAAEPAPPSAPPEQISRTLADMMRESGTAPPAPPAPSPPPATAPEVRIEALAQHFAKDTEMTPEAVRSIADNPDATLLLEKLGESLGIEGRPAPGEIEQIADRVGELRRPTAETPVAEAEQAFQEGKAVPEPPSTAEKLSQTFQDAADAAMERMRKRGTFKGERAPALPVDDFADLAVWGAAKLGQGTVAFAKWSKEMLADVAEIHGKPAADALKPKLADLYAASQKQLDRYLKSVTGALPNTRKLLDMYQKGIEGKDWYDKTWKELQGYFGDDAERFIDFLSATSANNTVPGNVTQALKAYMQWKNGQQFQGFLPMHIDMLNDAVAGNPFGGPKIRSFKKNLMGDPIPVTVDRWIARVFGFGDQPSPAQYKFMDYIVTQAARRKGVEPRQFQAALWKTMRDAAAQSSSGEAFEVVLKKRLMSDPDLAATISQLSRVQP